jgi:iron only hydrogenase large subunit-like protein
MACPGGCVAGAGTLIPIAKAAAANALHKKVSTNAHATQNDYQYLLDTIEEDDLKPRPEE